jgi:phosphoribosylanthranilate isomerase
MTKIKICGLSRPIDIEMVNEARPDYIGFVFAKSKRQVSVDIALELKQRLHSGILAVGVFVNEEPEKIIRICQAGIIDIIQLHGDEDESYLYYLRKQVSNPIMKAVRVRTMEDIKKADNINCDFLLLDAYNEKEYGGSGITFDWSVIHGITKPFFLAGGIHSGNVEKAIALTEPYGIDVSSGVEIGGYKDKDKVIDMIAKVRSVR